MKVNGKKKLIGSLLMIFFAFAVFAGGNADTSKTSQGTVVLRFADIQPVGYPTVLGAEEFARLVNQYSNGRIKVEVYPQGQLGDEKSAIEQVQFGGIDFTRTSISPLSDFQPLLNALQMPYLYRNADHMWSVLNGEIGEYFLNSLSEKGFVGLVYYDSGARNFYTTKKPIYSVADMKGLKIRVQESTLMMGLVQALGAVPTPMSYGDVYSALQTGVIDGAENNWPSYDSSSHFEVAKFLSIDEHTRIPEMIIASKKTMEKLSKEDQEIIKRAARESQAIQIKSWAEYEKKSEQKVRDAGCKINAINDQAEFSAAMSSLYQTQLNDEQRNWIEKIKNVK